MKTFYSLLPANLRSLAQRDHQNNLIIGYNAVELADFFHDQNCLCRDLDMGEQVVELTDIGFYADQIHNLTEEMDWGAAFIMACELPKTLSIPKIVGSTLKFRSIEDCQVGREILVTVEGMTIPKCHGAESLPMVDEETAEQAHKLIAEFYLGK